MKYTYKFLTHETDVVAVNATTACEVEVDDQKFQYGVSESILKFEGKKCV